MFSKWFMEEKIIVKTIFYNLKFFPMEHPPALQQDQRLPLTY